MNIDYDSLPEFNDYLDRGSDGEPKVISIGQEFESAPSKLLFDADKEGYEEEFRIWQSARAVAFEKMAREVWVRYDNRHRIEEVVRRVRAGRTIPFVGAGLSVPSGYPGWTEFLLRLAGSRGWDLSLVSELLGEGEHEEVVEELVREMPRPLFDERVEECFARDFVPRGSVLLIPQLRCSGCVTTNLDRCLERVFEEAGFGFDELVLGAEPQRIRSVSGAGDRWLLTLHGDAKRPDSRVLGTSDYDRAYGDDQAPHRETLAWICDHASLLFIGCSLRGDRVLAELLRRAEDGRSLRHYAIIEEPEGGIGERCAREDFLTERQIFPIWYPLGEHEYMEALVRLLVKEVQSR